MVAARLGLFLAPAVVSCDRTRKAIHIPRWKPRQTMNPDIHQQNQDALQILRSTFGYPAFRGDQAAVIDHLIQGHDALVLMPTGGGKSLCYQIPALVRAGTGVVVSPLIALMQNQVDRLREVGLRADFLNSTLTAAAAAQVQRRLVAGQIDLLYVAPERLLMPETLDLLHRVRVSLFAVDEAHCISQWGHDFRKDYLGLNCLAEEFPQVPRVALTATADERTREEIVARLRLRTCRTFVSSFNRPNIHYRISDKRQSKEQLLDFLNSEHPLDAGIIYASTRNEVEATATWLSAHGRPAIPYHAGLPPLTRQRNLERFLQEDGVIVVATIAFGMGIDKPDVRFVAHMGLPKNLEAYYQETGRAGRDGLPANAWMIYGMRDVILLRQLLDSGEGGEEFKRLEKQKIQAMLGYCESTGCRRQALLRYFGEVMPQPCGNCDSCLEPVITWDATIAAQMALSCVYRTGQRFGVNHVIDVLRGNATPRLLALKHDRVSTYGIGDMHTETVWRSIFRQLIATGLVKVDEHGSIQLDPSSGPLLRGQQPLHLRLEAERAPAKRKAKRPKTAAGSKDASHSPRTGFAAAANDSLRDALARHRLELARSKNLPSYCIFQNATLDAMSQQRPQTLAQLRTIPGVGDVKLEKYGASFLEILKQASPR
jgi:ATP-dependent DNA helicase RecQ